MTKKKDKPIQVQSYANGPVYQFWFEDGILHMWTNQRSGLFTFPIDAENQMHFLADLHHEPKEGTVYELKGIYKIKRAKDGHAIKVNLDA